RTDWVPFRSLMRRGDVFTMLGHVTLTALDRAHPTSFSAPVVSGLLRADWHCDGPLITDDFSMAAVYRSQGGLAEASIAALNAGVDLILVSYDTDQYYMIVHALLAADRDGRLQQDALRSSDERLTRAAGALARSNGAGLSLSR